MKLNTFRSSKATKDFLLMPGEMTRSFGLDNPE